MSRVLVVSTDYFGKAMAGPAIRCWEMSRLLTRHGHQVRLGVKSLGDPERAEFDIFANSAERLTEAAEWADLVVVQGLVLRQYPVLVGAAKRLVVDLYDPFNLEILELFRDAPWEERMGHHLGQLGALVDQLRIGDFFLCASEKQRDYWLGALTTAMRVNPYTHGDDDQLRRLIDVAPFGIPEQPIAASGRPAAKGVLPGIGPHDRVVIWGGGIYNWFDPITLIRAWRAVVQAVPNARLLFLGVQHPNPDVPAMAMATRAIELSEKLRLRDHTVHFNLGWVPYERRRDFLLEAEIGVTMHFNHVETAFSFRTRILDYIWAGIPIVATEGDEFARWIEAAGTGRSVRYEDEASIAGAIVGLLNDREAYERSRSAVTAERPKFTWECALRPLLEYAARPWGAPDLVAGRDPGRPPANVQLTPQAPRRLLRRAIFHFRREGPRAFAGRIYRALLRRIQRVAGESA